MRKHTLKVDYENNAEVWWDAARERAKRDSQFAEVLHALKDDDEWTGTAECCATFLATAATLPGWAAGDARAPHPVIEE